VCAGLRAIESPLQVDVLIHHREQWRPSSTGHLVTRVISGSRQQVWRRERQMTASDVRVPGRDLWILDAAGDAMPVGVPPESVQILLLDGSWREASAMSRAVSGWGHRVRLPMSGESRYWLRDQQDNGRFSTAEALVFLFRSLGLAEKAEALRTQLELHVYASLRARGSKEMALAFLQESPLREAFPELLAQLHVRRPREDRDAMAADDCLNV
jgi:DTW domain-containing protein YfiP